MILDIPLEVQSQNVTDRMHWRVRHKHNLQWKAMMAVRSAGYPRATGKRRVTVTAYRKRLIADYANLVGGCKGLMDALTHAGLIVDDKIKWMEAEYRQELCRKDRPHTVVEVVPI
jgi:hypothetical protein